MLKVWHAPATRSIRILWLLEELELPYEVETVEFRPPQATFFQQDTPTAADVMMGFSVVAARLLGVLTERHPRLQGYVDALQARPALAKARELS